MANSRHVVYILYTIKALILPQPTGPEQTQGTTNKPIADVFHLTFYFFCEYLNLYFMI